RRGRTTDRRRMRHREGRWTLRPRILRPSSCKPPCRPEPETRPSNACDSPARKVRTFRDVRKVGVLADAWLKARRSIPYAFSVQTRAMRAYLRAPLGAAAVYACSHAEPAPTPARIQPPRQLE